MAEQTVFIPGFVTPPAGPLGTALPTETPKQTVFIPSLDTNEAGRLWYQQQYSDLLSMDNSPDQEAKRLTSIFLAKAVAAPSSRAVYLNFDNYAEDYFKKKDLPLSYLQAAQNQWRTAWTDIETSKLGLMTDPENEEKWAQYDQLMANRPRGDNVKRNFLGQAGLSAIQFIPSMVDTGLAHALFGAGGALIGGAIGSAVEPVGGTIAGAKLGYSIGGKVGGTIENIRLEANSIFLQVMNTIDPTTGQPVYKNPELRSKFAQVARSIAIPFGAVAGALEELSFEKLTGGTALKPLIEKSGLSVIKNWVESGKLQNFFTTMIAKYGANIATETLQETAQTLVEQIGTDTAIEAGNAAAGTNIPTATVKDYVRQLTDTAKSTAMGMMLIGIHGSIQETRGVMAEKSAEKADARRTQLVKEAEQALMTAKDARAAEEAAAPQAPATVRLVPAPGDQAAGTAAPEVSPAGAPPPADTGVPGPRDLHIEDPKTGALLGRLSVEVGTASVGIRKLETVPGFEAQAKDAVVSIMLENPGKTIAWDPQDTLGKKVRDQLLQENPRRQALQADLAELQNVMAEQRKNLTSSTEPASRTAIEQDLQHLKAEIKRVSTRLDAIGLQWYDESARPIQAGTKFGDIEDASQRSAEPWRETRASFLERAFGAQAQGTAPETAVPQNAARVPQNAELRRRLAAAAPGMLPAEVDSAAVLADIVAEAKGLTTQEWMEKTFAPEVFAQPDQTAGVLNQGGKAAVQFLADGKALVHFSQSADFSSWVHELAHILRRQLTDVDSATAAAWAGATGTTWSEQAEEQFAQGFEDYLRDGIAPTPELRTIFQRMADWLRRIYNSLSGTVQISPEIRRVYDRIMAAEKTEGAAPAAGLEVLHQPGSKEFTTFFKKSKVVDEAGRPLAVYHGTTEDFGAFQITRDIGFHFGTKEQANAKGETLQGGRVIPVYLSIQNPLRLTEDIFQRGEKVPLTMAAEVLSREAGLDESTTVELKTLAEKALRTERTAETLEQVEAARKEFWGTARRALQAAGYDGIRYPNAVEGAGESWVAFEGEQIKSTANGGTWSPNTDTILLQPSPEAAAGKQHEESTREAVEAGEAVPEETLAEYADRDWAKAEIDRRARLAADASAFDSAEEFGSYAEAMAAPGEPPHASDYYAMIWEQTRQSATTDRQTANEQFLASMTREGLSRVLQEAAQRGMVDNLTGIVKSGALSVRNGGILTEAHYLKIMAQLRDDPAGYRAIFAGITGDESAIRQLEAERREKETPEEKLRAENRQLRRETQRKDAAVRAADRTASRERSYSADLEAQIAKIKAEKDAKIAGMKAEAAQKLADQKATLTTKGRDRIKEYRERQKAKDAKSSKDRKTRGNFNKKIRELKRIQDDLKYMHPDAKKPVVDILDGILLKGVNSKRRLALQELRQRLQADPDTEMSDYDMEKLAELDKTSVRDMSMEDFDSLYNAIKHYAWRNRQIQSTIRGEQQLHKEQAKEAAIGDLRRLKPLAGDQFSEQDPGPDTTPIDTTKDLLKSKFDVVDNLLGIGQNHYNLIVEKIAGIKSVIHKLFVENIEEGRKAYIAYKQKVFDAFHADIKELDIKDLAGWLNEIREVGRYKLRRGELLALWMHSQNEDNRNSLVMRGFGLAERKNDIRYDAFNTDAELMKLVNSIDPDELVFVRAAQKLFAQQGKDLGAVFLEKNGYELELVENYYPKDVMPIEYGKDQEKKDALDELQGRWTRVGLSKGMLKSRKGADVALNLHNIATDLTRSVEKSASYIAFEIPLSQASGLLYDKQFRAELSTRYSPRVWKAIEQGLRDIAGEYKPVDPGDKFGLALRSGMTQAFLGFNAWSPLKQITSLVNASPYVRADYLVRGFAETVAHPKASIEFNKKNSLLFYDRLESGFARDIAEASRDRGDGLISSKANLIRRVSFLGIKSMDSLAVSSVMRGAWLQAMDELASGKLSPEVSKALDLTPEGATKLTVDERNAQAFRFADYVSTRTQDQALPEYRSPLSRSHSSFMRFMTMFGSSTNTALGIIRQAFSEVQADPKSAVAKKKLAVAAFAILVMAPAAEASINALRNAVRGGLAGQPPDDEQAKKRFLQDYISNVGGLTYFVRDAVDMAQSTAAQLSGSGRYGGSSTIDPISTLYDTIQTTVSYGYRAATEEDLMQRRRYIGRFADSAALLVSLLSKLPLYMPTKGITRLIAPPEKKE